MKITEDNWSSLDVITWGGSRGHKLTTQSFSGYYSIIHYTMKRPGVKIYYRNVTIKRIIQEINL